MRHIYGILSKKAHEAVKRNWGQNMLDYIFATLDNNEKVQVQS